jgi:hypothetical protein
MHEGGGSPHPEKSRSRGLLDYFNYRDGTAAGRGTRLGRRTALTFPLLSPQQGN